MESVKCDQCKSGKMESQEVVGGTTWMCDTCGYQVTTSVGSKPQPFYTLNKYREK